MTAALVAGIVVALVVGFLAGARVTAVRRRARHVADHAPDSPLVRTRTELRVTTERLEEAEAQRAEAAAARVAAEERRTAAEEDRTKAEAALADSEARLAALRATPPSAQILEAMWRLQRLDLELHQRREAELSTAADADAGGVGLARALELEVERVREEIGTPGGFHSDLPDEPEPGPALFLLRSTQSTLDVLARRSQAFDLRLHGSGPRLAVTVLCEDVDGDADADTDAIGAAITSAGGALRLGRDPDGRIRAHVSVPAT